MVVGSGIQLEEVSSEPVVVESGIRLEEESSEPVVVETCKLEEGSST